MNTLSIDSSLNNIGMTLWHNNTFIKSYYINHNKIENKSVFLERIEKVRLSIEFISEVLKNEKIDNILVEMPTGSQSASAQFSAAVECCIIAYLKTLNYNVYTISTLKGKEFTGNKKATKKDIIDYVKNNHPEVQLIVKKGKVLNCSEHICDSVVNYLYFFNMVNLKNNK